MTSSRNKILERLKNNKTREENELPSPGFSFLNTPIQPLIELFEEKLKKVNGEFIACRDLTDFQEKLIQYLKANSIQELACYENNIKERLSSSISVVDKLSKNSEAAITGCEKLVAQTGSVVVSTAQTKSRKPFTYAPVHIVVAFKNQLVGQLEEALNQLAKKYKKNLPSQITTITGPSRTADIEKTLVLGAHGPRALIIFYIDVDF